MLEILSWPYALRDGIDDGTDDGDDEGGVLVTNENVRGDVGDSVAEGRVRRR